jgi:predicted XRE-type DNA-binding protein
MMSAIPVCAGSGNVFADFDLPNPDEDLAKSETCIEIFQRMAELGLTPAQAAERMGLAELDAEDIVCGRFGRFGLGCLMGCLNSLGEDVEIFFRRRDPPSEKGRLSVARASVAA